MADPAARRRVRVLIVMRGGLATAEKTMLEFGKPDHARQFRQLFENEVTAPFRRAGEQSDAHGVVAST